MTVLAFNAVGEQPRTRRFVLSQSQACAPVTIVLYKLHLAHEITLARIQRDGIGVLAHYLRCSLLIKYISTQWSCAARCTMPATPRCGAPILFPHLRPGRCSGVHRCSDILARLPFPHQARFTHEVTLDEFTHSGHVTLWSDFADRLRSAQWVIVRGEHACDMRLSGNGVASAAFARA